jgi:hypothetical protein
MAGCAKAPVITEGSIRFDPQPESVADSTLYITIWEDRDGTGDAIQMLERTIDREVDGVKYELTGDEPPAGDYVMDVHLDLDGDAEITTGDYTAEDIPVFLGECPETIDATLTPVE